MFNNLINFNDLIRLVEEFKKGKMKQILLRLITTSRIKKIKKSWGCVEVPPKNWWEIPAVRRRWNYMISGDTTVDYQEYISNKHLSEKQSLSALSIGCGTGELLFRWLELGKFRSVDAFDLSEERIDYAIKKSRERGYDKIINFHVADVFSFGLKENLYDIVIAKDILHHMSPLDDCLVKINGFLKSGGYFIVNEFVGPTRFQWNDEQLKAANDILLILPVKYRIRWRSGTIKSRIFKPGRLIMILSDPSEAVESSRILPLLYQLFDVIEIKGFGGNILHLLFADIAHNFLSENDETLQLLRFCFEAEDAFLSREEIQSDFVVAVCKKR